MSFVYNCKVCGAPLEVGTDSATIRCSYCNCINSVTLSGEKSAKLLNDAIASRLRGDFEQAKK